MNYFAHGRHFVHEPWMLAGTALPDWLSMCDRRVRVRSKHAAAFVASGNPRLAALARGVLQHHHDDDWFHSTRAFTELSWHFTARIREVLRPDDGLRPSFLGHILVELLLDAELIAADPSRLDEYYAAVERIDPVELQDLVNQLAPRTTDKLAAALPRFLAARFLADYGDDARLLWRLNGVMRRVGLPELPESLAALFPEARTMVARRLGELLSPEPVAPADPATAIDPIPTTGVG
jgi:hypothetical protein